MTTGSIWKCLVSFAIPVFIGHLFQQLYNLVDTWVIGQTGNTAAFAAVGSVGQIINILIGLFLGLSSGAGVIISQYFGAKEEEKANKTVHTAMALTLGGYLHHCRNPYDTLRARPDASGRRRRRSKSRF